MSQIDFFLMKRIDRLTCKDCKVIPGESITSQHRLLVLDVVMKKQLRKMRDIKSSRIRWQNLKGEKVEIFRKKILKEAIWDLEDETNILQNKMGECVKRVAKGILGESRGKCPFCKDTWWWNEDV